MLIMNEEKNGKAPLNFLVTGYVAALARRINHSDQSVPQNSDQCSSFNDLTSPCQAEVRAIPR